MYDSYRSIRELTLTADVTEKFKALLITCDDATAEAYALKIDSCNCPAETVTIDGSLGITGQVILPLCVTKIYSTSNGTTFPADLRIYGLN